MTCETFPLGSPDTDDPFAHAILRVRIRSGSGFAFANQNLWWITMARWPDSWRSNLIAGLLIFVLLPLLCWLAWVFVRP